MNKSEEFYVELVEFITKSILTEIGNQSQVLKIFTVGIHSALKSKTNDK